MGVAVKVAESVGVTVAVGVAVPVGVAVEVAVAVGVTVGVGWRAMTLGQNAEVFCDESVAKAVT